MHHTLGISSHSNLEAAQSENRGIPCGLPDATATISLSHNILPRTFLNTRVVSGWECRVAGFARSLPASLRNKGKSNKLAQALRPKHKVTRGVAKCTGPRFVWVVRCQATYSWAAEPFINPQSCPFQTWRVIGFLPTAALEGSPWDGSMLDPDPCISQAPLPQWEQGVIRPVRCQATCSWATEPSINPQSCPFEMWREAPHSQIGFLPTVTFEGIHGFADLRWVNAGPWPMHLTSFTLIGKGCTSTHARAVASRL